jgi:DnaJ-class molecular chaperone
MHIRCDACDGEGVILTHRTGWTMANDYITPDYNDSVCRDCNGEGWMTPDEEAGDEQDG